MVLAIVPVNLKVKVNRLPASVRSFYPHSIIPCSTPLKHGSAARVYPLSLCLQHQRHRHRRKLANETTRKLEVSALLVKHAAGQAREVAATRCLNFDAHHHSNTTKSTKRRRTLSPLFPSSLISYQRSLHFLPRLDVAKTDKRAQHNYRPNRCRLYPPLHST